MDLSGDTLIYIIGGLAFLVIAGVGIVLTGDSGKERAAKRAKQISTGDTSGGRRKAGNDKGDATAQRRKQTQQMLKKLREQPLRNTVYCFLLVTPFINFLN